MSDVLAAFLYGQLEQWQNIQGKRRAIWERYDEALSEWCEARGIRRPVVPEHCEQAYHMYYLLMPSLEARTAFIEHLAKQEIKAVFHYLPLHLSSFAESRELGAWSRERKAECPVTEDLSDRLVRLPFYTTMTPSEQARVICRVLSSGAS
jgi:dTDP-4-amino-4,6-dideoxygalactose transaminase